MTADSSFPKSHEVWQLQDVDTGLDKSYEYSDLQEREIAVRIYQEFKIQLDKHPIEHVQKFRHRTSYNVHRKWHAEKSIHVHWRRRQFELTCLCFRNIPFSPGLIPDDDGRWIRVGRPGFEERKKVLDMRELSLSLGLSQE